ncbi:MAG TPA: GTP 3',8-cyclase MoaA [Chitinophagaceae bacterium]|nr:GTP 3',8-cyclase MoaA [Chitinophagaceae bacterium]
MAEKKLIDKYGRQLNYLRLSVTDRCNIRCRYCMPEEGMLFAQKDALFTFEELLHISRIFCGLGISKIRITGGEPFVRKGLMLFLQQLSQLPQLKDILITTNGTLIDKYIDDLLQTRIRKINISLDSLDANRFFQITRRDSFDTVYANVFALLKAGFEIKLNCVLSSKINSPDIIPFIELTKNYPLAVRFLEEMPFNGSAQFDEEQWNYTDIYNHINQHYAFIHKIKDEAASTSVNYCVPGYKGTFGIIPAFSRTFCGTCNRIRLSATGELRTCLYGPPVANLRDVLRDGASSEDIENVITDAVQSRLKDGNEAEALRHETVYDSMSVLGG